MFIIIGIAAAVVSFTVVSSYNFGKRVMYQSRVINARTDAEKQIKNNYSALQQLVSSYEAFDQAAESVIGTGENNSKIVLDALPSKYDFPALTSSVEKILNVTGGISSRSVTGSDLEATAEQSSVNPVPIEVPLTISGTASYENIQKLISNLQRSIRPFKIGKISLSGDQSNMNFTINVTTYYMPAKNLEIQLTEVK